MIKTNYRDLEQLMEMINQHRKWMLESANIYGMGSEETLTISQELDELILVYQNSNADQSKTNDVGA
ncbi:aspartyl-phosphate phosphatase Spo0E family protein [Lentibacillus lipolyticus]|nr:aspartyl-phosphate phosphatase Spo0E family protein [Lentibacillus lipolyticus]